MNWQQLREMIDGLTDEQLQLNVTVWDMENAEYYPAEVFLINEPCDILDADHPFIGFNFENL
jgi:hypothetical protein